MPAPPLKTDPKFGHFPWWPEDGDGWLHPDDAATAHGLIPSPRVFRRDGTSGEYVLLHYGEIRLRARPALWQEVPAPAFAIGDWVEVASRGMENTPYTGTIREILWDEDANAICYQIRVGGQPINDRYSGDDLQRVEPTSQG
jgi:hypothetical protein